MIAKITGAPSFLASLRSENESAFGLAFKDTIDDGYPIDRKRKLAIGEADIEYRAGVEVLSGRPAGHDPPDIN